MHDLAFAHAARPMGAEVMGCPLLPYSLGHELILIQRQNPFILLSRDAFESLPMAAQLAAVTEIALVCSRDWRGNHRKLRFWHRQPIPHHHVNWIKEIATAQLYLDAARRLPATVTKEVDHICAKKAGYTPISEMPGRPLGSSLLSQLVNFCYERPAMIDGTMFVWDMPFALTAHLYFAHLEAGGSLRIENATEAAEREQIEQWDREARARQAAEAAAAPSTINHQPSTGLATPIPDALRA